MAGCEGRVAGEDPRGGLERRSKTRSRRQASVGWRYCRRRQCDLDQYHRRAGIDRGLERSQFQRRRARVLLRPRTRNPDPPMDGLRCEALRREAFARYANDGYGARLHLADLVHAMMIKRHLKEPLLHFLLLGAMLFAAHGFLSRGRLGEPSQIVVTQGQAESMALLFARTWQRPPSDAELQGLIRSYVREEVLYREGLALGLDRDDPIIRRRIAQKLEFATENDEAEPSDRELQAYLDAHPAMFVAEPKVTFGHVYLDPRRRGTSLATDAERMLNELNGPGSIPDPGGLGDPTMLPLRFDHAAESEVGKVLGDEFVKSLAHLEKGA